MTLKVIDQERKEMNLTELKIRVIVEDSLTKVKRQVSDGKKSFSIYH